MLYSRDSHNGTVMNRYRLVPRVIERVTARQVSDRAPDVPVGQLADGALAGKMEEFMQQGIDRGDFFPHDKTVAMAIASVMLRGNGDGESADESELYTRERAAFIRLSKTPETLARIRTMLDDGAAVRN